MKMIIEEFNTGGVLIIANITKCMVHYSGKAFNYNYPEGLEKLLKQGIIHIITTDESVDLIEFVFDKGEIDPEEWVYTDSYNYLNVDKEDEIRLVPHAVFTQMCNNHNGDLHAQVESMLSIQNLLNPANPVDKETILEEELPLVNLPSGQWKVSVYTARHKYAYPFSKVTFFFEKTEAVDPDLITLKPLEIFT